MVPRPLEQDSPGPDRNEPPAPPSRRPGGFGRRQYPAGAGEAATPGAGVALDQLSLRIEDGLLMAFGPEGDPMPPAAFIATARQCPDAQIRLGDGTAVPALRAVAVLEAQAAGRLADAAAGIAADAWIRSMLGLGPQPAMAAADELRAERRGAELTAFARELMISVPAAGAFLITEAAVSAAASAGLRLPDGAPVSVRALIERIRAELCQPDQAPSGVYPAAAEIALPECGIRPAGDAVVLELPSIGAVRLVDHAGAGPDGPRVGLFLTSGAPASVADLVAALGGTDQGSGAAATDHAAGDPMDLTLEWPEIIEAGADGTADLGVLAEALERCRALLASASVAGLPAGAALSAGRRHEDGSWSLAAEDLRGLQLEMPAEGPDRLALEITVRALQGEATRTLTVWRRRQADPAAVPASTPVRPPAPQMPATSAAPAAPQMPAASTAPIRLAVRPPAGQDFAPKDAALVIIGGVPEGAVLSAGIDNGDGSWMLSAQDLVGLELSLPAGCAGDLTLEVTALAVTSRDGAIGSAADRLRVALDAAAAPIPLVIDPAAVGGLQALMIRDLPREARLSAGTYDPASDAWIVLPRQLDGLSVTPADAADFTLTVMGIARDADGRAAARLVTRLEVRPA